MVPNCSPRGNNLVEFHIPLLQVAVEGINHIDFPARIAEGVAHDHHISPANTDILRMDTTTPVPME